MKVEQCYAELVAAMRQHISEELSTTSWLSCDKENFDYFKNSARQARAQKESPSSNNVTSKGSPKAVLYSVAVIENEVKLPSETTVKHIFQQADVPPQYLPHSENSVNDILPTNKTEQAKETVFKRATLNLEVPPLTNKNEFADLFKLWQEKFPHQPLLHSIPTDDNAKVIAMQWQALTQIPDVIVLSFGETPREKIFLQNLTLALHHNLASAQMFPVRLFESNQAWQLLSQAQNLRLLIANHNSLAAVPFLMKKFREGSSGGKSYLDKIPLHLLADFSLYMSEPHLKATLWRTLSQLLGKR